MSEVKEAADRISLFLRDEAVQLALDLMRKQSYRMFLDAKTEPERVYAQARALVSEDFETAMRAVVDAGERETLEQEQRDRAPATRTA